MRLRFLDAARVLAIAMMVLAHVRDGLMNAADNAHWLAQLHDRTRGFTGPLFFVISGWAFAAATLPKLTVYQSWTRALSARVERILVLFVIGRLLTLPWWHVDFPFDLPREVWLPFATSGVLECVAVAMALAHLCTYAARTEKAATWGFAALTLAAVVLARPVQDAAAGWPLALKGLFNADEVPGGFPLFPFAAYFFFGSFLGGVARVTAWPVRRIAAALAATGIVFLAARFLFEPSPGLRTAFTSPALFFLRAGWVLLILSGIALLSALTKKPAPLLEKLSGRALTFYVAHMLLLWGVPFLPGLVHRTQHALGLGGVVNTTLVMLAGIGVVCALVEAPSPREEPARAAES